MTFIFRVLAVVIVFSIPALATAEILYVKTKSLNLRTGPGKDYAVACQYGKGFPLKVLEKKGDWLKVADFENDVGWVSKQLLTGKTTHAVVKANKNVNKRINIRSGPGTRYKTVGQAYYGVVFTILGKEGEWRKIQHESGLVGWIQQDFLWGI